jgi:hypothetical protein
MLKYLFVILFFTLSSYSVASQVINDNLYLIDTFNSKGYFIKYINLSNKDSIIMGNKFVFSSNLVENKYLDKLFKKYKCSGKELLFLKDESENILLDIILKKSLIVFPLFNFYFELEIFDFEKMIDCCPSDIDNYRYNFFRLKNSYSEDFDFLENEFTKFKKGLYIKIEKVDARGVILDIKDLNKCVECSMGVYQDYSFLRHKTYLDYSTSLFYKEYSFPIFCPFEIYSHRRSSRKKYWTTRKKTTYFEVLPMEYLKP